MFTQDIRLELDGEYWRSVHLPRVPTLGEILVDEGCEATEEGGRPPGMYFVHAVKHDITHHNGSTTVVIERQGG